MDSEMRMPPVKNEDVAEASLLVSGTACKFSDIFDDATAGLQSTITPCKLPKQNPQAIGEVLAAV